ncbi:amino acid adenylation domain-containing protein [Streptomyces panaciradicis]|uniref:amino acid adenylation domain-containing protein n=1 Tax=Streptomyces panaciradicis TaxID=1470261 RepID=UPI00201D089A|nr:amino acid adenylation domain-containing protein [Streptomyces panaciradicis]MCL6673323.1 amino acid adenylation domain-containing protein [Streptomyces panaciradicis]
MNAIPAVPVSAAQTEIWLADRCEPESGRYNVPVALRFEGTLDLPVLRRALADLLVRHPILAGRFDAEEGELRFVPEPAAVVPLGSFTCPGPVRSDAARRAAVEAAQRPLDPAAGPLVRADVLHHDDGAVVVLTTHHIVADGRTLEVLADDVLAAYRARHAGQEPPAARPAPMSPATVPAEPTAYWEHLLDDEPVALAPLPDLVRAESRLRGTAAWTERTLSEQRLTAVRRIAVRDGVTPATVLLAAWTLLLHAWSGEQDGVLGMPFAGRHAPGTQDAVGLFTRVLPVRSRLDGAESFDGYAARLGEQVWDTMEAFAEAGEPAAATAPRYAAVFLHQPRADRPQQVSGATVHITPLDTASAKYDLALAAQEHPDRLVLRVDYDAALYTPASAQLMVRQLDALLAAAERPGARCLDLITALADAPAADGGSTARPRHLPASSVPALVLTQASSRPDAVAVVHGDRQITYGALVRDAARAAHWMHREAGVAEGDVVALLLEPGIRTVALMLAVTLAGAAYLPLDPAYPDAQLHRILDDARPRLLVTEQSATHRAPRDLPVHGADDLELLASGLPDTPPATALGPRSPLNVLYTSGSTGRPKGVLLHHGGVLRLMHQPDFLPLGTDDTVSHLSPLNFDGATYEIWGALTHGARLVVLDKELVLDPVSLRGAVRAHGVTTLLVTTPLLNRIIEDAPDLLQSMRRVYFGGELVSVPHLRKALRWARPGTLLHSYGPTENSFTSTWHPVEEIPEGARTVPIGQPVPGTRLYVVLDTSDGSLVPAPAYAPGELLLGGEGVALEYLGDRRRTAERFVPDPFVPEPEARLYRTGDRVRWNAQGQLEFIGRDDNQIKIRSQRVELGEVESALRAHSRVTAAFVTSRRNDRDEKEIIAYAVFDRPDAHAEVLQYLRACLPPFAVPAHLVAVDRLPLTANGKIDRRRLPQPEDAAPAPGPSAPAAVAAPAVPSHVGPQPEQAVHAAWREVLGNRPFGPDDNFFDVGGHSLLLVRLQAALRRATGTRPSMADLLRHTTVRAQSRLLGGTDPTAPPRTGTRRPPGDRPGAGPDAIAVVGMAARFAGALDLEAFWDNLRNGRDCFTEGPGPLITELPGGERRVARWGMTAGGPAYDPDLLGFSEDDLHHGDPQQGLLHEALWSAVEDASLRLSDIAARTSLYAGCAKVVGTDPQARVDDVVNADPTFVASRFAYLHDLWGEALMLDTACSTGLYAIHLACRSLLSGDSDYALAGAVSLDAASDGSYRYRPGFLYTDDGVCRPFDRRASGTVGGFGAGAVLLRRLADAERDEDPVYAVLRGSAVNNDGAARIGYSAPGIEGQARVIRDALNAAGLDGTDLGYVEAHGTGTRLGDAIEITALAEALGTDGPPVAVGSVKASIGHCDTAAGMAGFIKAVLAVHHGHLPATPNVAEPIEELDAAGGRFSLLPQGRPWAEENGRPRSAGVSSFGVGGTNAHVVVQEYRPATRSVSAGRRDLERV